MDAVSTTDYLAWLQHYPLLGLLIVFFVAFGESLALVGLIVPGAFMMVGFGTLIALGYLPFWATLLCATLGAIGGDGLSYWLGFRYQHNLGKLWPFSRHPELLPRGERFFARHGGKSIFLGRFVGPLRPIIPAVAGMLHMPLRQFLAINILSALLWAPVYLLPGILFGASLELASEFAGRFSLLLVLLLFSLWLFAWLIKLIYLWITPKTDELMTRLMNWSHRHPLAGEIPASIFTPDHPEIRGLSLLGLILILTTFAFIAVSQLAQHLPFIYNLNLLVFHALKALRSPPFDHAMMIITSLGDFRLLLLLVVFTAIGLLLNHNRQAFWHLLSAFLFPTLLVELLKRFSTMPRPPALETMAGAAYPSGHATLAMAVYGFIAILLAQRFSPPWRLVVYLASGILISLIAFSRLYLGAHWFTDVIRGLLLGLAWITLLGIAYRRHTLPQVSGSHKQFYWATLLLVPMVLYPAFTYKQQQQRYTPAVQRFLIGRNAWRHSGWKVLPASRHDLRGYHDFPFTLQWADDARTIRRLMQQNGWQTSQPTLRRFLNWFNPYSQAKQLPVLPHVHDGAYEAMRWLKIIDTKKILILRLWPAYLEVKDEKGETPLWYGNVSWLHKTQKLGLSYLVTTMDFQTPLQQFRKQLDSCRLLEKAHEQQRVLLIENCVVMTRKNSDDLPEN